MKSLRNNLGLASLFFGVSLSAFATEIVFKKSGQEVKKLDFSQLPKGLVQTKLQVLEPHDNQKRTYVGFDARKLLTWAYGADWKKGEEVLFTCVDGYQPSLPVERFLRFTGLFALSILGQKNFELNNDLQNEKKIPAGPAYLVWDNLKSVEMKLAGSEGWPYQVTSVDLVRFKDRFSHMAPPEGASAQAKRGFGVYRNQCMSCHALNGEGGGKGPDLNRPVSFIDQMGEKRLRAWIINPQKINPQSQMPGFESDPAWRDRMPEVNRLLDDLFAYLQAMKAPTK